MTRHVDLKHDIDTSFASICNDIGNVLGRADGCGSVRALDGEFGETKEREKEGLGVGDMPVEPVRLDPGHGVKRALYKRYGESKAPY